jgi:hypothetical protein
MGPPPGNPSTAPHLVRPLFNAPNQIYLYSSVKIGPPGIGIAFAIGIETTPFLRHF